jgi:outer membrane protein assembly factor BamA/autotransporter translocation and assembly factor TamB
MHRVLRLAGMVAAALAVLLLVALGALHLAPARRYVLQQVIGLLQSQHIGLSADSLRYNAAALSISLQNARLWSLDTPDLEPFVSIPSAEVDLSVRELIRGRYVVDSARLTGVDLHYLVTEDGRTNLPVPPARDVQRDPSSAIEYLVKDTLVERGRVRYEDRRNDINVVLPFERLRVDGQPTTDRHDVQITAGPAHVEVAGRTGSFDRLHGDLELGSNDVVVRNLELTARQSRLDLSGRLSEFANPSVDAALRAEIATGQVLPMLGVTEPIMGELQLQATMRGAIQSALVEATVKGVNLTARGLPPASVNAHAQYNGDSRVVSISSVHLEAPWGRLTAHGRVAADEAEQTALTARLTGIDAQALMSALELPYRVGSRVSADVQAEMPGLAYRRASGSAALTMAASGAVAKNVLPVDAAVRASMAGGVARIDISRLSAAATSMSGRVVFRDEEALGGQLQVRSRDAGHVVRTVETVLGRRPGTLVPTAVSGGVMLRASLSGRAAEPQVRAELVAPSLQIGTLDGIRVNALADASTREVRVHDVTAAWQAARVQASGRVALAGARPIEMRAHAESLAIGDMLAAAAMGDVPASGIVTAQAIVGGTLSRPRADLQLQAADLTAYAEPLGTLTVQASLVERQARVSKLHLDKPQQEGRGRLSVTGGYDLEARAYSYEMSSEDLRLEQMMLPDGTTVRGSLDLSGTGRGTIDDPRGSVTMAAGSVSVADREIGDVTASVSLADRTAVLDAAAARFATSVRAEASVESPYPGRAEVLVNDLSLEALPLQLGTPLAGRVRARVNAEGEAAALANATISATIETLEARWNDQPVTLDGPATGRYADRVITIDRLNVRAQDSTVSVSGRLPVDQAATPGALELDTRLDLTSLAAYAPRGMALSADGLLTVRGQVKGTARAIEPDLEIALENVLVVSPELTLPITGLQLQARVRDGAAVVERLAATWGAAQFNASGRAPLGILGELPVALPSSGGTSLEATLSGLNPAAVPGAPEGVGGRVGLTVAASAPDADLAALQGRATFDELELTFRDLTLAQRQPSVISATAGAATIEHFALTGSIGAVTAAGTVDLAGDRALDVTTEGTLDIAAASAFTDAFQAEGPARFQIRATGPVSDPQVNGYLELADATVQVEEPADLAIESLAARLDMAGRRVTLSRLDGLVNGGALNGSGFLTLGEGLIADADLQVSVDELAFSAPLDLRSLSDVGIRISRQDDLFVIDGGVAIAEAGLTGDVNFDTGILDVIGRPRGLDLTEERNPLLDRVRFNVGVQTEQPILVDNNLAKAEVTTDLRVLGSPYELGLSGRMELLEGSAVTLNERRYEVEQGLITFTDQRRITPSFDLRLTTQAANYDITLGVTGEVGETETTLTSNPSLPEPDVMALLVTGRTLDEMRGEEYDVAREQVLSYLTGRVGSALGRGIERATGLSEVRIEPNLIANEADPGARLTVGQELTDELRLVYSTDLADSSDQIWVAEYDITRRLETRVVRQSDNSYRMEFRHDVRFGGRPEPRRIPRSRPLVSRLTVAGGDSRDEALARRLLDVEEGDAYDFFQVREGVDRIEAALRDEGYLQSRVRVTRAVDADEKTVEVTVDIARGPRVLVQFEGVTPPEEVREEIALRWQRGVFDSQRAGDGLEEIHEWLIGDRHVNPTLSYRVEDEQPGERRVVFSIDPGVRFERVTLAFQGAGGVPPEVLQSIVDEQDLETELFLDPTVVTELLRRYYREEGYLAARLDEPVLQFDGASARIVVNVDEGPRFVVNELRTAGNAAVPDAAIIEEAPLRAGDPFLPAVAERSLDRVRQLYWGRGYNDVHLRYEVDADRDSGRADVTVLVDEGPRSIVADVEVQGNERTSESFVRGQLLVYPEGVLDVGDLGRSRRSLYSTGAYSIVELSREVVESPAAGSNGGAADGGGSAPAERGDQLVDVTVNVREVQPFQLQYGASYDTERGLGGVVDLTNYNSLGNGRQVGFSTRYDSQLRQARLFLSQPMLRRLPLQTTISAYVRQERNPLTDTTEAFNVDRLGASLTQERRLAGRYVWNYGLRYEQARTFDPRPGRPLDETTIVSPLTSTFTRETRDEVLDATRGAFVSQAFSYSPGWLGSDATYLKYYGQYFKYLPLERPTRERLTNEIIRPRLVFATGVRLGLAWGVGSDVPFSERFFAGGSTTVRGFGQNAIGPTDVQGIPTGGSATLILNNELRFPILSVIDGVGFVDVGGVFPRVSDWSWSELREAAGVGVRVRTPWFLLRGDYGFVLDRRPGERRGRFFFSIGQAF